jgi:hypothetical protein
MASTYSNLGINLQGTGDNSGTWGQLTNVNLQELDAAIAGVAPITLTGNTTLAFTSNSSSTTYTNESGRNKIVVLSGSLSATTVTVTVPNIQKDYVIVNNTGATVIISAGGSTTVTIPTTTNAYIYSNGSSSIFFALPLAAAGLSIGGTTNAVQYNNAGALAGSTNLTFNGTTLAMQTATALNLTATSLTATSLTAVTATVSGTASVQNLLVTSLTIYSTITATSVVTSASLVPTGVTSGSYTAATITVGSDGRITSAASGSGGAGGFVLTKTQSGPSSGTYTASPTANRLSVYMFGGGGGGGKQNYGMCRMQENFSGGTGGYGFFNVPITQPYAVPFIVGAGGPSPYGSANASSGGSGNASNFGPLAANAGGGGAAGGNGAPGNAPLAALVYSPSSFLGLPGSGGGNGSNSVGSPGFLVVYENTGT